MTSANDAGEQARRRAASVAARLRELAERRADFADGTARASSADDMRRAENALAAARKHAERALISARDGYLRAAVAHERTAERYEASADGGHGDAAAQRARAANHRRWAAADRRRAAELSLPNDPR